ncbi:MAG: thrombospondin type 3 repeat-containing protein, partial [Bacteroidota bacterium]
MIFLDYHTPIQGSLANFNTTTGGWELSYSRSLSQTLNFVVPVQFGVANFLGEANNRTFGGMDALIQLQFYKGNNVFIPYMMAGVGGRGLSDEGFNFQVPVGVGFHFRLGPWAYLSAQGQMRISPTKERSNLQYGLGFTVMFNEFKKVNPVLDDATTDRDSDGITDDKDKCPDVAGVADFDGCPDTDGDGVADEEDDCPEEAGVKENKGCPLPDADKDGVPDQDDECPDERGLADFKGCPDTDGDGVADKDDQCPKVPGEIDRNGCPITDQDNDGVEDTEDACPTEAGPVNGCPDKDSDGVADKDDECPNLPGVANMKGCPDTDGDGVADGNDRCPNTAGTIANKGCPEIKAAERQVLTLAMQAVQFETGSAQLKSASYDILNQIHQIMLRYPNYNL